MTEKLKPEPATRVKAADDVDAIYAHIQRVRREKAEALNPTDPTADKMAESARPAWSVDYCGFDPNTMTTERERLEKIAAYRKMTDASREWQAEWARRYRESHWT